jgi:hypothetical protein
MEISIPHQVIFETEEPVPVSEIIASLLGAEQILRDVGPLFEEYYLGFKIDSLRVSVRLISQESPLKEFFYLGLVATYQKDLVKDVPAIIYNLTGNVVPAEYTTLVTIMFCLLAFYGVEYIYSQVNGKAFSKRLRAHTDELTKELSRETGVSEEKIKSILESKFGKGRIRVLGHAALSFFAPSKRESNAPVVIGNKRFDSETIAEIPSEAQIEEANVPEIMRPFESVQIELHAQDMDHAKQGWAAVVPTVTSKRLRMEIYPPN